MSEDHQTKNARALSDVNSAILLKDIDAEENLYHVLNELINDTSKMEFMSQEIKKLAKPNATEDIVNQIEQLLK